MRTPPTTIHTLPPPTRSIITKPLTKMLELCTYAQHVNETTADARPVRISLMCAPTVVLLTPIHQMHSSVSHTSHITFHYTKCYTALNSYLALPRTAIYIVILSNTCLSLIQNVQVRQGRPRSWSRLSATTADQLSASAHTAFPPQHLHSSMSHAHTSPFTLQIVTLTRATI